jgi:hypothetical protein
MCIASFFRDMEAVVMMMEILMAPAPRGIRTADQAILPAGPGGLQGDAPTIYDRIAFQDEH